MTPKNSSELDSIFAALAGRAGPRIGTIHAVLTVTCGWNGDGLPVAAGIGLHGEAPFSGDFCVGSAARLAVCALRTLRNNLAGDDEDAAALAAALRAAEQKIFEAPIRGGPESQPRRNCGAAAGET